MNRFCGCWDIEFWNTWVLGEAWWEIKPRFKTFDLVLYQYTANRDTMSAARGWRRNLHVAHTVEATWGLEGTCTYNRSNDALFELDYLWVPARSAWMSIQFLLVQGKKVIWGEVVTARNAQVWWCFYILYFVWYSKWCIGNQNCSKVLLSDGLARLGHNSCQHLIHLCPTSSLSARPRCAL
jgi:hypothetical protein